MTTLLVTTNDVARIQFATTSLYHFIFVPLTLGLAPILAIMQRSGTARGRGMAAAQRFFGTLMLINFAIGVPPAWCRISSSG